MSKIQEADQEYVNAGLKEGERITQDLLQAMCHRFLSDTAMQAAVLRHVRMCGSDYLSTGVELLTVRPLTEKSDIADECATAVAYLRQVSDRGGNAWIKMPVPSSDWAGCDISLTLYRLKGEHLVTFALQWKHVKNTKSKSC